MSETYTEIRPEPQRDRYGRYLITPPDGGKPRAYTRATTIAETLDDRYNLEAWKVRMTALGIVQRPDLYASIASTPADDKSALNRLCDQAREAAAGSAGANLGTALHRFTERINRGEDVTVPAPWDADVAAYQAAMQFGYRYQINPHWLERIVVLHELQVAGTFDLLLDDMNYRYIADLKTGQELSYSWPAIAVQLALYAHADALYNPTDGTYEDMPAVDQERAIVIHLPAGKATCTIHEVDLVAGWEAAQHAMWVRGWRKRKGIAWTLGTNGTKTTTPASTPSTNASQPSNDTPPPSNRIDKLRSRYSRLDYHKKLWIDRYSRPDIDDYELGLMLVRYAELDADDELLRAAYRHTVGRLTIRKSLKDAINAATPDQIATLSQLAVDIHKGTHTVTYTVDGITIQPATERATA